MIAWSRIASPLAVAMRRRETPGVAGAVQVQASGPAGVNVPSMASAWAPLA